MIIAVYIINTELLRSWDIPNGGTLKNIGEMEI